MTEYVHVGTHADILQSGVGIGPGHRVTDEDLGDEDQVLLDEGVLVDVNSFGGASNIPDGTEPQHLTKQDLLARAGELGIDGRSKMTVDELRAAIAAHDPQGGE